MLQDVSLEVVRRTDPRYQEIRNRHYVENNGTHGQQLHYLIHYGGEVVGIISGASSVYGVAARDEFFGIPKNKDAKQKLYLPAIINNTVFRLEEHHTNLATKTLALWRKVVAAMWEDIYEVRVIGFETFVVENDRRKGALYKADNWEFLGETKGNTKAHKSGGLTAQHTRQSVDKKLIYAKWNSRRPITPTQRYESSWRSETPEEKARAKKVSQYKEDVLGLKISSLEDLATFRSARKARLDNEPQLHELFDF